MKHIRTISEFHEYTNLPKPDHSLISVINVANALPDSHSSNSEQLVLDFYSIAVKRMHNVKIQYGQQPFDFNEGVMSFMSPKQVFSITSDIKNEVVKKSGWAIYIHPDFIWNTSLAKTINNYNFWDYTLNEALFLSEKEEASINHIIQNIRKETQSNIDKFSKHIIISQIETLLNYADRFYSRQFITREKSNHQILEDFEILINDYFNRENLIDLGLPTVQYIAQQLNVSPKYLSSLFQTLTGQTTQQLIHDKLIEKAKEKLSTSQLTVSEISYSLGFEHIQSFSKLFKIKTNLSPKEFRQSFN
ncbi:helix-turn-helix transcriptional regulator [Pedobacter sp. MC2016-05]|uniref:helix-turn-helix domain-containing protein n=1 Tax=Pedobacter sp. MC2016-05 TaxID=2994474 RepID=UPI0022465120|nr:helix-turn-helix transcriptional regulator [Pedobacter sp. MC2016-05]MCX2476301.1 helix-turn-helix transcriptional regulator [Pedobacter sp. MC2016-05]